MLANLIISADLPLAERLARAAVHESGHAAAALHFGLPLREVLIREDGSGSTRYHCRGPEMAEASAITNFSGAEAERDVFLDWHGGDSRDRCNIDEMIAQFGLDWDQRRLATLRFEAQILVGRLRPRIQRVACELVRSRHLTASAVAGVL